MSTVEELLKKATEKYPTIAVEKALPLTVDPGNLCGFDSNPLDLKEYKSNPNAYLNSLARDDVQLVVNAIWTLPTERDPDGIVLAKLPEGTTIIPRFQKVPQPKPPTKWERYAKEKGIKKRKKTKLEWDEELKKWIPRFGYKKVAAEKEKNWLIEIPATANPMEDQFAKAKDAKKERIAKNELQRLRNIARTRKVQVPTVGVTPLADPATKEKMDLPKLKATIPLVRKATASVGQFTKDLPKEKKRKAGPGKKRKFETLFNDIDAEKQRHLDLVKKITDKAPRIHVDQAVNQETTNEHIQAMTERREGKKGRKSKGKKAAGISKKAAKRANLPVSGKGKKGRKGRGKFS